MPPALRCPWRAARPADPIHSRSVRARDSVVLWMRGLGGPPRAAIIFDCAGRKRALAVHSAPLEHEAGALIQSFGDEPPPLTGLYTHGEIGRVRGAKGDRNHAVVV